MLCLCALFQSSCRAAKLINKYLILSDSVQAVVLREVEIEPGEDCVPKYC